MADVKPYRDLGILSNVRVTPFPEPGQLRVRLVLHKSQNLELRISCAASDDRDARAIVFSAPLSLVDSVFLPATLTK
jgi:hypothetical protein